MEFRSSPSEVTNRFLPTQFTFQPLTKGRDGLYIEENEMPIAKYRLIEA
jgi:hypothetical protein